jgi:hypothetical protein
VDLPSQEDELSVIHLEGSEVADVSVSFYGPSSQG